MANYTIDYSGNRTVTLTNSGPLASNNIAGLTLMGQNYANYGQPMNQNWMSLAENFYSNVSMPNAVPGQLWYNPTGAVLQLRTAGNTWANILTSSGGAGNATFDVLTANYFVGNGNSLANITGANVTGAVPLATLATSATTAGTVSTAAQPNITTVGTLSNLNVSGNITAGGNITATTFIGNIQGKFVVPGGNTQVLFNDEGDANASPTFTFNKTTNTLTVNAGNVIAGGYTGSGAGLSSLTGANVTGTVPLATRAAVADTAGTVTVGAQPNITSVGTLSSLTVTNTITGATVTANSITANVNAVLGNTSASTLTVSSAATINSLSVNNSTITVGGTPTVDTDRAAGTLMNYYDLGPITAFMGWNDDRGGFVMAADVNPTNPLQINEYGKLFASDFIAETAMVTGNIYSNISLSPTAPGNLIGSWSLTAGGSLNTSAGSANLGSVGNVKITGGSAGQRLTTDGAGNLSWTTGSVGTVSNVATAGSGLGFTLTGGPITTTGTVTLTTPTAAALRTSLTIGNVANLNLNSSTTQFLRGDGAWGSPLTSIVYGTENITFTTATGGTQNFDILSNAIQYTTVNPTSNFTLNIRGNATVALSSILNVGQSTSATFLIPTGATPYGVTALQIDGASTPILWSGANSTPAASSLMASTFTIIRGSGQYTVLGSLTRFA